MKKISILILFLTNLIVSSLSAADTTKTLIWEFDIKRGIDAAAVRIVNKNIANAEDANADYILIRINTYGGALDSADSIRTKILNCKIPTIAFIDNQAASAGALISIACDSIYMRTGGSIGAATVVDQTGAVLPDKYQSFMRSMMRSTAEAHGKKTIIKDGEPVEVWHRDPKIAEAMVDQQIYIEGVIDTGKVLTFTTKEAITHGFCEGKAENVQEVLAQANITNYEIIEYQPSLTDSIIHFLLNPVVQGILIMLMFGGIYFELQTPGVGFPLVAAIIGALLYFSPLYIEGLAENWEIIVFVVGLILLLVEIFVIPGWGVAGVSGILLIVFGLTMSMIDNEIFKSTNGFEISVVVKPLCVVVSAMFLSIVGAMYMGKQLFSSNRFKHITLRTELDSDKGFVSFETTSNALIGTQGIAQTKLTPSGKVIINNEILTAIAEYGFIEKGQSIVVTRFDNGQLYCEPSDKITL